MKVQWIQSGPWSTCAQWYKAHQPSQPVSRCAQLAWQNELDCTQPLQRLRMLLELDLWFTSKTSSMSLLPTAHRFTFYCIDTRSTPKQGDRQSEFKDLLKFDHWIGALLFHNKSFIQSNAPQCRSEAAMLPEHCSFNKSHPQSSVYNPSRCQYANDSFSCLCTYPFPTMHITFI